MDSIKELKAFLQALPKLNDKDREARAKRAKEDFRYFVQTYLGHHIGLEPTTKRKETSIFRNWVYNTLPILSSDDSKINKIEIKADRGAAKTTLVSRLFCLWKILRGDKRYAILISSTLDLAKEGIDVLKTELEDNSNLINDFGITKGQVWNNEEIVFSVTIQSDSKRAEDSLHHSKSPSKLCLESHAESKATSKTHKVLPTKTTKKTQLCKIKSFGAGKKIRGTNFLSMRPDLIICDDIENDENTESKSQRDKLYNWFNKAILKLPSRLNPHYTILVVGTTLHYDSLLQRIAKRNDFAVYNFPLVLEFPSNIESLTKENLESFKPKRYRLDDTAINLQDVLSDFLEDKASFYSEFQNEPLDKDNAPLSRYTTYSTLPKVIDCCVIGIDPSLGKQRGDYFALSTLFYAKQESKLYASSKGYKLSPDKMIDKILTLFIKTQKITPNITIACEEVAFQEFFKNELKKRFLQHGIFAPILGIKNTTNKEVRLDSLSTLLSEGDMLIHEKDLLLQEELDTYPKCPHDDLLDSLEIAKRVLQSSMSANYKESLKAQREWQSKFRELRESL